MAEELILNFRSAFTATYLFLDTLWIRLEGKISKKERDNFASLMGAAYDIPSWFVDWEEASKRYYNQDIDDADSISSRDCLQIFKIFLTILSVEFDYDCPFLLTIVGGIEYHPERFVEEKKLWRKALKDASLGNFKNDGIEDGS